MTRFGAVDVHYPPEGGARAALVVCPTAVYGDIIEERTIEVAEVAEYRPGNFYERELPPLRALLSRSGPDQLDILIVDGYVTLDPDGRSGLGAYVHAEGLAPIVIGVAKTPFHAANHAVEVPRGTSSTRPLYVTAAGMPTGDAAHLVRNMAGDARLPEAQHGRRRPASGGSPSSRPPRADWLTNQGSPRSSIDARRRARIPPVPTSRMSARLRDLTNAGCDLPQRPHRR
ncbi:endonuclease V [Myceligenerans xiligouense]|uniref:endonuclease V n=1 Tax=Myceligenerans xiligouense TaxID=253184 RepID=UPI000F4D8E76|nr:endonuclease V [Myceligenerans xiligouense]